MARRKAHGDLFRDSFVNHSSDGTYYTLPSSLENDIMSLVTFTLSISEEKCFQRGEDAPLRLTGGDCATMIACMDGCGGSGGRHYPQFGGWSGARISSRLIGNAIADWFYAADIGARGTGHESPEVLAEQLRQRLSARLLAVKVMIPQQNSVVSSHLSKTMPSTLAAILVEGEQKNFAGSVRSGRGNPEPSSFL